jgi:HJR/Mrr/RecB family endonuclease
LDTLELLDEKKFVTPSQTAVKASESFDNEQDTSLEKYEIDNQSKLQIEKLNKSFHLLFKESSKFNTNDKLESKSQEIPAKTVLFNESIKAYVDVCCQIPGLVCSIIDIKQFK